MQLKFMVINRSQNFINTPEETTRTLPFLLSFKSFQIPCRSVMIASKGSFPLSPLPQRLRLLALQTHKLPERDKCEEGSKKIPPHHKLDPGARKSPTSCPRSCGLPSPAWGKFPRSSPLRCVRVEAVDTQGDFIQDRGVLFLGKRTYLVLHIMI
jgi:hypothetical protein